MVLAAFFMPVALGVYCIEYKFLRIATPIYALFAIVQYDPATPGLSVILAIECALIATIAWNKNSLPFIIWVGTGTVGVLAVFFGVVSALWWVGNFTLAPGVQWFLGFQKMKLDTPLAYISMAGLAYAFLFLAYYMHKNSDGMARTTSAQEAADEPQSG